MILRTSCVLRFAAQIKWYATSVKIRYTFTRQCQIHPAMSTISPGNVKFTRQCQIFHPAMSNSPGNVKYFSPGNVKFSPGNVKSGLRAHTAYNVFYLWFSIIYNYCENTTNHAQLSYFVRCSRHSTSSSCFRFCCSADVNFSADHIFTSFLLLFRLML